MKYRSCYKRLDGAPKAPPVLLFNQMTSTYNYHQSYEEMFIMVNNPRKFKRSNTPPLLLILIISIHPPTR